MVNCNLLRELLEAENPRIYIFDRKGQRMLAVLRFTFRFSRDRNGEPRIGIPVDIVFYDVNQTWQERVKQVGNTTVLRARTLYVHEVLQLAEWLKRFAELVEQYVVYCLDGTQQVTTSKVPPPPPSTQQQQQTPQTPPSTPQGTEEEIDFGEL